jgi:hypothetical protein
VLKSGAGYDDAPTEREGRDLAASDAEIRAGTGDPEELGDLGDGVGATFVHGNLLGGMDDTDKRGDAARRDSTIASSRNVRWKLRSTLRPVGWLQGLIDERGDLVGCFFLHAGDEVAVDVEGERDRRVAEPF